MLWMNILTALNFILLKNYYPTKNYFIPITLFCIGLFWVINNYLRKKRHENYGFHTSFLGYSCLLLYIIISFALFVYSVELLR